MFHIQRCYEYATKWLCWDARRRERLGSGNTDIASFIQPLDNEHAIATFFGETSNGEVDISIFLALTKSLSALLLALEGGNSPNVYLPNGLTPLHLAVAAVKNYSPSKSPSMPAAMGKVLALLDANADPNAKSRKCTTPVHLAAAFDTPEVLVLLHSKQGSLTARDIHGNTALHIAVARGSVATVRTILAILSTASDNASACKLSSSSSTNVSALTLYETDVNSDNKSSTEGHNSGDGHVKREYDTLPLNATGMAAASAINAVNARGETPLLLALRVAGAWRHKEAHAYAPTYSHGDNSDECSGNGEITIMPSGARAGYVHVQYILIAQLLVDAGADVFAVNTQGHNAREVCAALGLSVKGLWPAASAVIAEEDAKEATEDSEGVEEREQDKSQEKEEEDSDTSVEEVIIGCADMPSEHLLDNSDADSEPDSEEGCDWLSLSSQLLSDLSSNAVTTHHQHFHTPTSSTLHPSLHPMLQRSTAPPALLLPSVRQPVPLFLLTPPPPSLLRPRTEPNAHTTTSSSSSSSSYHQPEAHAADPALPPRVHSHPSFSVAASATVFMATDIPVHALPTSSFYTHLPPYALHSSSSTSSTSPYHHPTPRLSSFSPSFAIPPAWAWPSPCSSPPPTSLPASLFVPDAPTHTSSAVSSSTPTPTGLPLSHLHEHAHTQAQLLSHKVSTISARLCPLSRAVLAADLLTATSLLSADADANGWYEAPRAHSEVHVPPPSRAVLLAKPGSKPARSGSKTYVQAPTSTPTHMSASTPVKGPVETPTQGKVANAGRAEEEKVDNEDDNPKRTPTKNRIRAAQRTQALSTSTMKPEHAPDTTATSVVPCPSVSGIATVSNATVDANGQVISVARARRFVTHAPLLAACWLHHDTLGALLLRHNAAVNVVDAAGNTPLLLVCRRRSGTRAELHGGTAGDSVSRNRSNSNHGQGFGAGTSRHGVHVSMLDDDTDAHCQSLRELHECGDGAGAMSLFTEPEPTSSANSSFSSPSTSASSFSSLSSCSPAASSPSSSPSSSFSSLPTSPPATSSSISLDLMLQLLFYRAAPNVANTSGATPLSVCAENNDLARMRVLLAFGADPNAGLHWTPLNEFHERREREVAERKRRASGAKTEAAESGNGAVGDEIGIAAASATYGSVLAPAKAVRAADVLHIHDGYVGVGEHPPRGTSHAAADEEHPTHSSTGAVATAIVKGSRHLKTIGAVGTGCDDTASDSSMHVSAPPTSAQGKHPAPQGKPPRVSSLDPQAHIPLTSHPKFASHNALWWAVAWCSVEMVDLLTRYGAHADICDERGKEGKLLSFLEQLRCADESVLLPGQRAGRTACVDESNGGSLNGARMDDSTENTFATDGATTCVPPMSAAGLVHDVSLITAGRNGSRRQSLEVSRHTLAVLPAGQQREVIAARERLTKWPIIRDMLLAARAVNDEEHYKRLCAIEARKLKRKRQSEAKCA